MKDRLLLWTLILVLAGSVGLTTYKTMIAGDFEVTHTDEWELAGEEVPEEGALEEPATEQLDGQSTEEEGSLDTEGGIPADL